MLGVGKVQSKHFSGAQGGVGSVDAVFFLIAPQSCHNGRTMSIGEKARALHKAHILVKRLRDRLREGAGAAEAIATRDPAVAVVEQAMRAALADAEEAERKLDIVLGRPTG